MSKEQKGHKVCFDKAESIRTMVELAVANFEKVPRNVASVLREGAKVDSDFHRDTDEEFQYGYGPAVQKEHRKNPSFSVTP